MNVFQAKELQKLYNPQTDSNGEDNGQITIIGGSSLFKGAPLLSIRAASRVVDMVFFSSPEPALEKVASFMHADTPDFIWVPYEEIRAYIEKSDAVLIGPGFMRFASEFMDEKGRTISLDSAAQKTRELTHQLLSEFPNKKWVIDAGSLQTIDPTWIPANAIVTPNRKEFKLLFQADSLFTEVEKNVPLVQKAAAKYNCIIVLKGATTIVASPTEAVLVKGGNPGLTKGGSGDTQAGLTTALLAKNEPFLAACAAAFVIKKSADEIYSRVGVYYNASDIAEEVPRVLSALNH